MNTLENLIGKGKNGEILIAYVKDGKTLYSSLIFVEDPLNKQTFNEFVSQCMNVYEELPCYGNDICSHPWVIIFKPEAKTYLAVPGPYTITGDEYPVKGCYDEIEARNLVKEYETHSNSVSNDDTSLEGLYEGPSIFPTGSKIRIVASGKSELNYDDI